MWERGEPSDRAAPAPLSRDQIVRAAITVADAGGLTSVSFRRLAASLDVGPMRLYGYVSSKEEVFELMVDAVYGEMASAGPICGGWRESLREVAYRTRQAARKHEWLVELLGSRPNIGPNGLAYLEASIAALSGEPGFEDVNVVMQATGTVNAYVIGALRLEASERRAEHETGLNQTEWQQASWPYLRRMMATGRFPTLARVLREAGEPSADDVFDEGLNCVLNGIAAGVSRSS